MSTFIVSLDGALLAKVNTDGFEVLSIRLGGTRVDDEFAVLDVSAGAYPEGREKTHLIWINSLPVRPGQLVQIGFAEEGATSHPGKTIGELFPDEEVALDADFKLSSKMFAELRRRPSLRDGYSFNCRLPSGEMHRSATTSDEHGFGLNVLWNAYRPERASFSLHTYTIDSIEQRSPGRDHLHQYFSPGQYVAVEVDD